MLEDESAPARTARHLFERAYARQEQGALGDAIRLYKESIAHYSTAEAHTFLGWAYAQLKQLEAAIEECQQAIALDPQLGNPYNDIGAYFIELGWWREAIPWLEKALAAPRYANREFSHLNLGRVFEHLGRWDKARQAYRAALEINPGYQPARLAYRNMLGRMD
jgi:Tfp pilus assembly protein PilF